MSLLSSIHRNNVATLRIEDGENRPHASVRRSEYAKRHNPFVGSVRLLKVNKSVNDFHLRHVVDVTLDTIRHVRALPTASRPECTATAGIIVKNGRFFKHKLGRAESATA